MYDRTSLGNAGSDNVLRHLNKSYTLSDAKEQLSKLNEASIRHNGIFMLGLAGSGNGIEHATDSAQLINSTMPQLIGVTSLGFFEGANCLRRLQIIPLSPQLNWKFLRKKKHYSN